MYHKFTTILCIYCGDYFDVPVYCGDRFCPICSYVRQSRIRNRLNFLVKSVDRRVGYCFKHLTLTIKNQTNLFSMTRTILKSFRKLRATRSWKNHVAGGAFVVEVTGNSDNWHVHLHVIIQSKYYAFAEILKLWSNLSPGRGVYIQNIPKNQIVGYLTKYLSKTSTLDADRSELNKALKGIRLFHAFGSWFALNKKYKPPKPKCKKCGNACFCLYSEVFRSSDFIFEKQV